MAEREIEVSRTEKTVPLVLVGDTERIERGLGDGGGGGRSLHFGSAEIQEVSVGDDEEDPLSSPAGFSRSVD